MYAVIGQNDYFDFGFTAIKKKPPIHARIYNTVLTSKYNTFILYLYINDVYFSMASRLRPVSAAILARTSVELISFASSK